MSKFKFLSLLMLFVASTLVFSSCSDDDDDDGIKLTKEMVVGRWNVVSISDGKESLELSEGTVYIVLDANNSYVVQFLSNRYVGNYIIKGNSVVGTTLDPITEYFRFEKLSGNNATIDYSNSEGVKYIFQAVKSI